MKWFVLFETCLVQNFGRAGVAIDQKNYEIQVNFTFTIMLLTIGRFTLEVVVVLEDISSNIFN